MNTEAINQSISKATLLHSMVETTFEEAYGLEWIERNQDVVNAVAIMVQIQEAAKLVVAQSREWATQ